MTAYFDGIGSELHTLQQRLANAPDDDDCAVSEATERVEVRVVLDVTLCAEWTGCPVDIRDAIHRTVLRWSAASQPRGSVVPATCDYADVADHLRGIGNMCSDLHTIFHALSSRCLPRFTDDPRRPLWDLASDGEERREAMTQPNLRYWIAQIRDYDVADQPAAIERVAQRAYNYALATNGGDVDAATVARTAAMAALKATEVPQ